MQHIKEYKYSFSWLKKKVVIAPCFDESSGDPVTQVRTRYYPIATITTEYLQCICSLWTVGKIPG